MKQLLSLFLFLLPCFAWAQYPSNGNQKITLGEQTSADGLIWRGVLADTGIITPLSDTSAYIILDTVNHRFYNYNRATNVWSVAGGGTSVTTFSGGTTGFTPNTATSGAVTLGGTLAVANGGTGTSSFSPNNYLIRTNSSGIFDTANIYEANGNVGINVIPSSWGSAFKAIESGDNNNQSAVAFNTGANGLNFFANAFFDGSNSKYKYNGFASRFVTADGKYEYYSAPSGTAGDNITFTEVMTINSSGNLGINQPIPTEKLHVVGNGLFDNAPAGTTQIRLKGSGSTTGFDIQSSANDGYLFNRDNGVFYFGTNNLTRMRIFSDGKVGITDLAGAGSRTVEADVNGVLSAPVSSINYKENVQTLDYGLNELLQINPVSFDYINKDKWGDERNLGFIVEDMFSIIPEVTGTMNNGDMYLDMTKLIPVLTKAIQEQNLLIKALEQRIINLENK